MGINVTLVCLLAASSGEAAGPTIAIDDPDGAAGRVMAPVCAAVDLQQRVGSPLRPELLRLVEMTGNDSARGEPLVVQFEPAEAGATKGRLWWLLPPGPKGQRRFRLVTAEQPSPARLSVQTDAQRGAVDVREGSLPIPTTNGAIISSRCSVRMARR